MALAPCLHRVELPRSLRSIRVAGRIAPSSLDQVDRCPPSLIVRHQHVVSAALGPSVDVRPRSLAPSSHGVVRAPSPFLSQFLLAPVVPCSRVPLSPILVKFVPFSPGRIAVDRTPPALPPRLQADITPLPFRSVWPTIFAVGKLLSRR